MDYFYDETYARYAAEEERLCREAEFAVDAWNNVTRAQASLHRLLRVLQTYHASLNLRENHLRNDVLRLKAIDAEKAWRRAFDDPGDYEEAARARGKYSRRRPSKAENADYEYRQGRRRRPPTRDESYGCWQDNPQPNRRHSPPPRDAKPKTSGFKQNSRFGGQERPASPPPPPPPPPPRRESKPFADSTMRTTALKIPGYLQLLERLRKDVSKITNIPTPPTWSCGQSSCEAAREKSALGCCDCNIKYVFRDISEQEIKKLRLLWHPDKFSAVPEPYRKNVQAQASQIFVVIEAKYRETQP